MGPVMLAKHGMAAMGLTDERERERLAWHMVMDAEEERHLVQSLVANHYDVNAGYDSGLEQLDAMDEPESTVEQILGGDDDAPPTLSKK